MKQKVYAILRKGETETKDVQPKTLYKFKYDGDNNFFVKVQGAWIEEASTAFDFLPVA